jgi:hypothetical protein
MTREEVMEEARKAGLVVEPCAEEGCISVRGGVAPDPNERMRLTSDGVLLTVHEGYYWQVGTVEDVSKYLKARQT